MLLKKSGKKLAITLAGTIVSYTAFFSASIPKSQAAVLTYNIHNTGINSSFTGLKGSFKVDYLPSELSQIAEGIYADGKEAYIARKSVKEGTLYETGLMPSVQNFPESIKESFLSNSSSSFNLAGKEAFFVKSKYGADPWKLAGLYFGIFSTEKTWQAESPDFQGNNGSVPIIAQWSRTMTLESFGPNILSVDSIMNEVSKKDYIEIAYPGGIFRDRMEVNGTINSDKAYIHYELVSQSDSEPVPEPMTLAGTALAIAGFVAWKRMKKTAC
jgi:hypothetical protein